MSSLTRVCVLNMCAFDAFCQCLCCTYSDSVDFQKLVNGEETDNQLLQLVKAITTEGVSQKTFREGPTVCTLFKSAPLRSGTLQIDAQCNITSIIQRTIRNIASVYIRKQCSSEHCRLHTPTTKEISIVCLFIAVLQESGMAHLQTATEQGLSLPESPCLRQNPAPSLVPSVDRGPTVREKRCLGTVTHRYGTGDMLWLDTDLERCPPTNSTRSNTCQREFSLNEFTLNLILQGKKFILRAIIAFRGGMTPDTMGYYVSFCRRAHCVWELYDDLRSGVQTAS